MNVRWWAVRLLGTVLLVVALGIAVILFASRPSAATCDTMNQYADQFGTAPCLPVDWSPVWWLLGIGAGLFILPSFFSKRP